MNRNYPANPLSQPIKGIFIFKKDDPTKARELMKTLHCEVMSSHGNRVTIKTSRGNLQTIKKNWQNKDESSATGKVVTAAVAQIIIGGNAR